MENSNLQAENEVLKAQNARLCRGKELWRSRWIKTANELRVAKQTITALRKGRFAGESNN